MIEDPECYALLYNEKLDMDGYRGARPFYRSLDRAKKAIAQRRRYGRYGVFNVLKATDWEVVYDDSE